MKDKLVVIDRRTGRVEHKIEFEEQLQIGLNYPLLIVKNHVWMLGRIGGHYYNQIDPKTGEVSPLHGGVYTSARLEVERALQRGIERAAWGHGKIWYANKKEGIEWHSKRLPGNQAVGRGVNIGEANVYAIASYYAVSVFGNYMERKGEYLHAVDRKTGQHRWSIWNKARFQGETAGVAVVGDS